MIVRAPVVLTMDGPPIANGAVAVRGGKIAGVGKYPEIAATFGGPVADFDGHVLLPGLINAHCHLDYTLLRRAISPRKSFTEWIKRINAIKSSLRDEDYLTGISRGFEALKKWGTTTVLNIESFPGLMSKVAQPPIRTWWFYEWIDLRHPPERHRFKLPKGWLGGVGVSPHAPYTASVKMYQRARKSGMLVTTHLAESSEEQAMFRDASGPLFEFLKSIGRPMRDCGRGPIVTEMFRRRLIGPGTILAHVNEVEDDEFPLLRGSHIVHCPRSHAYFGHRHFAWKRLRDAGANLCLGTDSLASNDSLSMFAEMQKLAENEPSLRPQEILAAVTVNPAFALGEAGRLGVLRKGAWADLIAVPCEVKPVAAYAAVVAYTKRVPWVHIGGVET